MTTLPHEEPTAVVTALIRARLNSLTPAGRKIGETVLGDPSGVIHLTVTDLAERTGTSVATVVRFCQDLGLRGYQDLKIRLASESIPAERALHDSVDGDDDAATILQKVLRNTVAVIEDAAGVLDPAAFGRAVEVLQNASRVLVIGVGTSGPLAQDSAYRLRTAGLETEAPYDAHVQHVAARLLGPADACLAVSHTGQTRETLACVEAAVAAGASTIAVTSFLRSPITKLAGVSLVAGSRETNYRVEAMASRIAHIAVLDALFVAVCARDPERAQKHQGLSADVITEHRI